MKTKHDVLIVQTSSDSSPDVIEFIRSKGFGVKLEQSVQQIRPALKGTRNPIILVEARGEEEGFDTVKRLIALKDIYNSPLVLTGPDADNYEGILNRYFKLATTINTPCSHTDILNAINFIANVYQDQPEKEPATQIVTESEQKDSPSEVSEKVLPQPTIAGEQSSVEKIPEYLFEQLSSLKLIQNSFGAKEYVRAVHEKRLPDKRYLPKEKSVLHVVNEILNQMGKWERARIHRVAFLTWQILDALSIDVKVKEDAKAAALLYTWCAAATNVDVLRRSYIGGRKSALRRTFGSKVKDSAVKIAIDLKLPIVSNIVATLGRLLAMEDHASNEDVSIAASAIMAADLTDRTCWESGYWNPRSVYQLLRTFKKGKVTEIHPAVLCCLVRMLSEAMAELPGKFNLPRNVRQDPGLLDAERRTQDEVVGVNEKKVPLARLMPGMRLSRPLHAFDGRLILNGNLILDEDLIWRIWQLSAVRPLNSPLVVVNKQERRSEQPE